MDRRNFMRTSAAAAAAAAAGAARVSGQQGDRNVLQGVEQVGWGKTACLCFVGSVESTMRYLGEDVTTAYMMGISGGAFVILWGMPWNPSNCDIMIAGDEVIERTFAHLGYTYQRFVYDPGAPDDTEQIWRRALIASIDRDVPVLMQGPVGPPECMIVTGYERGGEVLRGWSYFQEDKSGYFTCEDWYGKAEGMIVIGAKQAEPAPGAILPGSLDWALKLAHTREFDWPGDQPLLSGFAAYDAFIEALGRDEEFPVDEPERLEIRWYAIANDGAYIMGCKRNQAAAFLDGLPDRGFPCPEALFLAADAYREQADIWGRVCNLLPTAQTAEERWRKLCDRDRRYQMASLIRAAKAQEDRAVQQLNATREALARDDQ